MLKKTLLMVSLIFTVSVIAMDPNKANPFKDQFKKTNDLHDRIKSNEQPSSSFKGSDGNNYFIHRGNTYSESSWDKKNRDTQERWYKNKSTNQNDCRIF